MKILTFGPVRRPNIHHRAKFHADRSNHCRDMANFRFFKMAAVRHLGFSNVGNFTCLSASEGQCASLCQILHRSVNLFRRYEIFFKMAGLPRLLVSPGFLFVKFLRPGKSWKF